MTNVIKQTDGSSNCVACCAAMLTGHTVEEVHAWLGNNVGDSMHDSEFIVWAIKHGWWPALPYNYEQPVPPGKNLKGIRYPFPISDLAIESSWKLAPGGAVYITVRSNADGRYGHGILLKDDRVYDPAPSMPDEGTDLSPYTILQVLPMFYDEGAIFRHRTGRIQLIGEVAKEHWWPDRNDLIREREAEVAGA